MNISETNKKNLGMMGRMKQRKKGFATGIKPVMPVGVSSKLGKTSNKVNIDLSTTNSKNLSMCKKIAMNNYY
jgi:hypothetical protein